MMFFVSIVCALFFILLFRITYKRLVNSSSLCAFDFFSLMYAVTYGLMPCVILLSYYYGGLNITEHDDYKVHFEGQRIDSFYVWIFLSFIAYFVCALAYGITKGSSKQVLRVDHKGRVEAVAILFLLIGSVCMYLWSMAYDGIFNLIIVSSLVRSGLSDVTNSYAFFKHPVALVNLSTYLFLSLWKLHYKKVLNTVLFFISFFLSILYLLANDGRMAFAVFFLILILLATNSFEMKGFDKKKLKYVGILFLMIFGFILVLDTITTYIKSGEVINSDSGGKSFLEVLGVEFGYIYSSGQHAVNKALNGNCPYLLLEDIRQGLYAWLPTSYKPDDIVNVWNYNTLQFASANSRGQTPTDFITTMVYDLGLIGPVILPLFWGWLIKKIDLWHKRHADLFSIVIYAAMSMLAIRLVNYNLLYDMALGSFYIIIALFIWYFYNKICELSR